MTEANMYVYHVKDRDDNYCQWSAAQQKFVPIEATNPKDYTTFTQEQKLAASFHTSMYGAISKIPAFYTVEVRELLVGTQYKVEERLNEIPDGYSRIRFDVYDDDEATTFTPDPENAQGSIGDNQDPYVEVHNIRGYGIRHSLMQII